MYETKAIPIPTSSGCTVLQRNCGRVQATSEFQSWVSSSVWLLPLGPLETELNKVSSLLMNITQALQLGIFCVFK